MPGITPNSPVNDREIRAKRAESRPRAQVNCWLLNSKELHSAQNSDWRCEMGDGERARLEPRLRKGQSKKKERVIGNSKPTNKTMELHRSSFKI